jgi:hypothetical protein
LGKQHAGVIQPMQQNFQQKEKAGFILNEWKVNGLILLAHRKK